MPSRESANAHSFPPNFPEDTPHFYQALAEHNDRRGEQGLPPQNFSQITEEDRHDILSRADRLKFAARPSVEVITYRFSIDGKSIECMVCGMVSYVQSDIRTKYCSNCHAYHSMLARLPFPTPAPQSELVGREKDRGFPWVFILGWFFVIVGIITLFARYIL